MKLTREEALAILQLEEGASDTDLKKAYYRLAQDWHPDKRPESEKQVATRKFQQVSAAYQRLIASESDDEDEWDEDSGYGVPEEVIFAFFSYMESKMRGDKGGRSSSRPSGGDGGFFFAGGGDCRCPNCQRRFSRYSEYSDDEYDSDQYDSRQERRWREQEERRQERAFMRTQAHERERWLRHRQEREAAAVNAAKEKERREKKWLEQLPRPHQISRNDHGFVLSVDNRGKGGSRLNLFPDGNTPSNYFVEVEMRPVTKSGKSPWEPVAIKQGSMEVDVENLISGTKYAFRARTGITFEPYHEDSSQDEDEEDEVVTGEWSVEAEFTTSGIAPKVAPTPTVSTTNTASTKSRRTKPSKPIVPEKVPDAQQAEKEAELAKAAEDAKRAKDAAIQAALAAAAADYEAETSKFASAAGDEKQNAAASGASGASKKSKKKKAKAANTTTDNPPPPVSAEDSGENLVRAPAPSSQATASETEKLAAAKGMSVAEYLEWKEQKDLEEAIQRSLQLEHEVVSPTVRQQQAAVQQQKAPAVMLPPTRRPGAAPASNGMPNGRATTAYPTANTYGSQPAMQPRQSYGNGNGYSSNIDAMKNQQQQHRQLAPVVVNVPPPLAVPQRIPSKATQQQRQCTAPIPTADHANNSSLFSGFDLSDSSGVFSTSTSNNGGQRSQSSGSYGANNSNGGTSSMPFGNGTTTTTTTTTTGGPSSMVHHQQQQQPIMTDALAQLFGPEAGVLAGDTLPAYEAATSSVASLFATPLSGLLGVASGNGGVSAGTGFQQQLGGGGFGGGNSSNYGGPTAAAVEDDAADLKNLLPFLFPQPTM